MTKILYPDDEDINKILSAIESSLPTLESLKATYADSALTLSHNMAALDYGGWDDDVQKMFSSRTNTFKTELDKIHVSVDSTHLSIMISKLNELSKELQNIKSKNARYQRYESYTDDDDRWIWDADKGEDYIMIDGVRYNNASFDSLCRRAYDQIEPHIDNANKIINYISSIDFDSPVDSADEIAALSGGDESSNTNSTEEQVITRYIDSSTGCTVEAIMTTTEVDGNIVQIRTITYTDLNGEVQYSESFEITMNADDPRQVKVVDEEGNTYETTVDEDGQLSEVTHHTDKNGNTTTETNPIGETYYTMTVTNNSTGETTTHTLNVESPADRAIFRMLYENANMEAGTVEHCAAEGNHHFVFDGAESMTLGGLWGNPEVTVTLTPSE